MSLCLRKCVKLTDCFWKMTGYKSFILEKNLYLLTVVLVFLIKQEKNLLGKEEVVFRYVELTEIGRSGGKNNIGKT